MRTFTDAHRDWLTVVRLPAYAPDLNPAEGVWANMKNGLATSPPATSASCGRPQELLKSIQYRPERIGGFLSPDGAHARTPAALAPMPFHKAEASALG